MGKPCADRAQISSRVDISQRLSWRAKSSHLVFLLPKTKGGSAPRPNSPLLASVAPGTQLGCSITPASRASPGTPIPATGAWRSGRHDIPFNFRLHQSGNCSSDPTEGVALFFCKRDTQALRSRRRQGAGAPQGDTFNRSDGVRNTSLDSGALQRQVCGAVKAGLTAKLSHGDERALARFRR